MTEPAPESAFGNETYRFMLDSIAQAVVGLDLSGHVTYWNAAATELYGWSSEEAMGREVSEFVASDIDETDALEIFERLLAGESWSGERMLVRRDGTRIPAFVVQNGIYSSDGRLLGIVGVTTDLTAAKRTEAELRKADAERQAAVERQSADDARWRAILLQSADGAIISDPATHRITFASPAVTRLFGWTHDELVGRTAVDLVHPADRRSVRRALEGSPANPAAHLVIEFRLLCADGSYRWVEDAISRPTLNGAALGLVGNLRDITERRLAQQERHQREQLTKALAAKSTDIALVVDREGTITYTDRSASPLLAGEVGENWGRDSFGHVHPDDRQRFDQALNGLRQGGSSISVTYRRLSKDGTWRWAEQKVTNCLDDPDIHGLVVNVRDIHERVEAERALRASESRYRMIVETAQEGIVSTDVSGAVTFANQKMADIFGLPLNAFHGGQLRDLVTVDPQPDWDRLGDELRSAGSLEFDLPYTRPDGNSRVLRVTASRLHDDIGVTGSLAMVSDVTEAVANDADLQYRAFHDPLTGLGNRALLVDRLQAGDDAAVSPVSVLLADIDQFKLVNDSLGHASGDELLVAVAERWRSVLRPDDLLTRIGGDEFVVVCEDCDEALAKVIAARLHDALSAPVEIAGRPVAVRASIGIAVRRGSTEQPADAILGHADAAMYEAKRLGRGRSAVFTHDLIDRAEKRLRLTQDLKVALDNEELTVEYQPIVALEAGRLRGLEALCRWQHELRGPVSPDEFIPVAEESGLIQQLDRWVLRQACRDVAELRASGILADDTYVTVNCSAHNLALPEFEQSVRDALSAAGLPARALVLEVTESAVMRDPDAARRTFERLGDLGVRVAMDDFGTGHSSLSYLRRFPLAMLKVDRSFVSGITTSRSDLSIVSTIIDLAHALGLSTVCEGIETAEELALLRETGCEAGQGWLWSRALPADALRTLLLGLPDGFRTGRTPTAKGARHLPGDVSSTLPAPHSVAPRAPADDHRAANGHLTRGHV